MSSDASLEIMLTMLRVLSHKVRTPLSVISNDLSYFRSLIDPNECERGIFKCRQISEIFRPAQLLQDPKTNTETFELEILLSELFADRFKKTENKFSLSGSRFNLSQALIWLSELFPISAVEIYSERAQKECRIAFSLIKSLQFDSDVLKVSLLTEIYLKETSDDSIVPMLLDAVLISFGAEARVGKQVVELVFR